MKKTVIFTTILMVFAFNINAQEVLPSEATIGDFLGMTQQEYQDKYGKDICAGDLWFFIYDFREAEKEYRKAARSKDLDVMLLGAYRLMELETFKGKIESKRNEGAGALLAGAYSLAYSEALIKKCLKKKGTPNLTMEEFYAQKNILTVEQMFNRAYSNVKREPEQPLTASNQPVNQPADQSVPQTVAPQQSARPKSQTIAQKSDVDTNIPIIQKGISENTFVVIIANENYQEVSKVPYTINDGEIFAEYCKKTLGIPESNISLVKDATANNMKREIRWLTQILEQFKGEAQAIVYYAGHGIPDESTKDSYLLPVDGYGDDPTTGYSLNELYKTLNSVPSKSTVVFLDACFSGAQRDGGMLASARGVAIKAKPTAPLGNMVVFSAAQGDETAYPYKEQNHGLFTYYLLKKLQESEGNITLGELSDYITDQVGKKSIIVNRKSQTPTVSVSSSLKGNWKELKLK